MNIDDLVKTISEETGVDEEKVKKVIDKYNEKVSEEAIKQLEKAKEKKKEKTYVGPPRMEQQILLMLTSDISNDL